MDLYRQAIGRFVDLLRRAQGTDLPDPNAMTLATVDESGRPSVRTVLLKGVDDRGFTFYTNTHSRKGRQLAVRPRAALCFHWQPLAEQVQLEGDVEPVTPEEADAYFATRPRESQLGAWASRQSEPLDSRETLLARVRQVATRFEGGPVPRPPHWSGYRVLPERIEFWTAGASRLHHRTLYWRTDDGWQVTLLNP